MKQSTPFLFVQVALIFYNGVGITYDAIGNPTDDGTWTYQWQAGRQLKRMAADGMAVSFKYDHNGLRVGKVVNGSKINYTLHGKLVTGLKQGTNNLHFFYDSDSKPAFVNFNGTLYTYLLNLQGDIVGLLDSNGAFVVEYKYNAWGRKLSVTGSLASTLGVCNPFRYRGYVYDEETGLYYLRTRYYNSEWTRFVNPDSYMSDESSILGKNAFTYCVNSPIMLEESSGAWPKWAKIVVAVVAVVAVTAVCVATAGALAAAAVGSYGVLSTTGAMTVAAVKTATAVGGAMCGGSQLIEDIMDGDDDIDMLSVTVETMSGSTYGMVNGASGGAAPIVGKLAGALGRAAVGAANALSRAIGNRSNVQDTVKKVGTGAGVPIGLHFAGVVKNMVSKRKGTGLMSKVIGAINDNPATKTLIVKASTKVGSWISRLLK